MPKLSAKHANTRRIRSTAIRLLYKIVTIRDVQLSGIHVRRDD
jgi:hypothetical protein